MSRTALESQLKLFAQRNADYLSVAEHSPREGGKSSLYQRKGPLMLVKSKLHHLLLRMRHALITEVGSDRDFKRNMQSDAMKVEVLTDNTFSFFGFTGAAESESTKHLLQFDIYLQEVCSKEAVYTLEAYNPPKCLPSLLYLYVYLLRLERCVCAFQIHDLKTKLLLENDIDTTVDRMDLEHKVRSLVNIILIAVCEKVYISKLIMPFIGNLEFEYEVSSVHLPTLHLETQ